MFKYPSSKSDNTSFHISDLALRDIEPTSEQCRQVLEYPDSDLMLLVHEAYKVRYQHFGNRVHVHVLRNVKSGLCSEDCQYCAQSRISHADIEKYPLVSKETLLEEARKASLINASRFCMATSGARPGDQEIEQLCDAIYEMKKETHLPLCASVGLITEDQAFQLKSAGLDRINHNLNTSRRYYPRICTTHTYQDRVDTIIRCRAAGLEICCGGIVGQGETDEDIIDLMLALRVMKPEAIPINFLIPVAGTPFGNMDTGLDPRKCLKILCLARLLNPKSEIRAAGGWEYHMRSLKPLALYPANSIFVTGYLTTGGTSVKEACDMITDLGFESSIEDPGV
jgi:biotin synthase